MAIATGALIAAGIGAAASVGGAALSSKASKKATKSANQTAERNTAANNALTREMYDRNSANLLPYSQTGLAAGNTLNAMLLGNPQQAQRPMQQPANPEYNPGIESQFMQPGAQKTIGTGVMQSRPEYMVQGGVGGTDWNAYVNDPMNSDALADYNANHAGTDMGAFGQQHYQNDGARRDLTPYPAQAQPSAWDNFRNSTNYQFRLDQGNKGINQGYAANGMLESGAAMKGIADYNQQFASNELNQYQDRLAQQQQVGLGAVSALAGVGQNMVNNVTANNNSAAQVAAQGAIQRGAAQGQLYSGIAGGIGNLAGAAFGGSSYRPPNAMTPQFNGLQRGFNYGGG